MAPATVPGGGMSHVSFTSRDCFEDNCQRSRNLRTRVFSGKMDKYPPRTSVPVDARWNSALSIPTQVRVSSSRGQRSGTLELRLKLVMSPLHNACLGTGSVRSSVRASPRLGGPPSWILALLFPIFASPHFSKPGKLVYDTSIYSQHRCSPRYLGL